MKRLVQALAFIVASSSLIPMGCHTIPLEGKPVMAPNGKYRLPSKASCSAWGFSEGGFHWLREAISDWEDATDGAVSVRLDGGVSFHCEIFPAAICPERQGLTERSEGMIAIMLDEGCVSGGDRFKSIAMHELGHAFGIGHSLEGLMRTREPVEACVDSLTLAKFCAIHECSKKVHPTCTE